MLFASRQTKAGRSPTVAGPPPSGNFAATRIAPSNQARLPEWCWRCAVNPGQGLWVRGSRCQSTTGDVGPGAALLQTAVDAESNIPDGRDTATIIKELADRLERCVLAEQHHAEEAMRKLYQHKQLKSLQDKGVALANVQLEFEGLLYTSFVYRLHLCSTAAKLPWHRFVAREVVALSRMSNGPENLEFEDQRIQATVLDVKKRWISLVLEKDAAQCLDVVNSPGVTWRMDKTAQDTTARRQLEAIHKIGGLSHRGRKSEGVIQAMAIGLPCPISATRIIKPEWVHSEQWRKKTGIELKQMQCLNQSQRRAIAQTLIQSITLWQGPPGSGKTHTLVSLLDVVCRTSRDVSNAAVGRILACADTNAAVDNIAEGLLEKGVRVVRVGQPARVRSGLRHVTLDALAERTPQGRLSMRVRREAVELQALASKESDDQEKRALRARSSELWYEANEMLSKATASVLDACEVIASTCNGVGDPALANYPCRMVVVDEATQATEPATFVALTRGVECLVMAGDPKQLPPTVVSKEAVADELDVTLFDRLQAQGLEPLLLDTQYRMHPAISEFPSHWFYDGRLATGVQSSSRPPPAGVAWPRADVPVLLVTCRGRESKARSEDSEGGASYRNAEEAEVAVRLLSNVLAAGGVESVAILTPYRAQAAHAEQLLNSATPLINAAAVAVSSVDGYQGREADVVIFSAVRSNDRGAMGFVADARRLNVAITRARRGLIVVANPATLKHSPDWAAWISWVRSKGSVVRACDIPLATWETDE
ncbi:unnamed protein product [Ostreobium quekettii]|uniref:Uncharacterized protein n=1 Tax=Ostreobium quekettii TaxID=121088 RepID=A0A8S1J592_9CHLO|nr:unnamed protein product [Ostreobium quekettii]